MVFLVQDDAWERTARVVSMIHNTTRTKENECKPPDYFNDTLRPGAVTNTDDGWIEDAANGKQIVD